MDIQEYTRSVIDGNDNLAVMLAHLRRSRAGGDTPNEDAWRAELEHTIVHEVVRKIRAEIYKAVRLAAE